MDKGSLLKKLFLFNLAAGISTGMYRAYKKSDGRIAIKIYKD